MKTIEERTKAIDDAELLNLKSSQGNYRTMLEKVKEYLSTASQEDLDTKYNELSEFISIKPATTVYDEASYEQGYHDAIGKAAGEEMGLGKPWEPDWNDGDRKKYCIFNDSGSIRKGIKYFANSILAFPTQEMQDAFYENFKELIELCKELL